MVSRFYKFLLHNQVILALFLVIMGWFIFQIRGIIVSIFLSYVIMAALFPAVKYLRSKRVPHVLAVLIPYIAVFLLVFMLIIPLIPFVMDQISSLLKNFPTYLEDSGRTFGFDINPHQIQDYISKEVGSIGKNAIGVTGKVFGGVLSTLTVLVVGFYFLMYSEAFKHRVASFFDREHRDHVKQTMQLIDDKLGAWLRGQVVLCFAIGLTTYIALSAVQMPYALPLALIAGMFEILPTIGPIVSAVPAVIVALTISPTMAIIVIIAYLLIQALENNLLVPKIMQRAVGLNPVVVILAIMIGANLMGIAGALLAIPFVSFVIVLFKSITLDQEKE